MCWKRKCAAASMPIFFAGSSGEKHYQGTRHSASCHATLPELIIASDLSRNKLWISLITKRTISITPRTLEGSKLRWLDRLLEESWIRGTTADGTTKGSELPVSRARPHMEQLMRPLSVPTTARPLDCKEEGGVIGYRQRWRCTVAQRGTACNQGRRAGSFSRPAAAQLGSPLIT